MTGFVFTFSLFCSAVLNSDPAVLQRGEFAAMRQIIESVIPETQLHRALRTRQSHVSYAALLSHAPSVPVLRQRLRASWGTVHTLPVRRYLSARPIRAPSAC